MASLVDPQNHFEFLSELLLSLPSATVSGTIPGRDRDKNGLHAAAAALTEQQFLELKALAASNHVIVRGFEMLEPMLRQEGNNKTADLALRALDEEHLRINHALSFCKEVCSTLENNGCAVTVIKSLDHWPDLGSDLDLYTDADARKIVRVMTRDFDARVAERSWGDRLANKWNFVVPGLPELIEVHVGRLGQTGEQTAFTEALLSRTRFVRHQHDTFRVLSPEDRIVISTMQRMYRHFYIRLCDVLDNASLLDAKEIDFNDLYTIGTATGLWEGIATYLVVISQYVETYRRHGVALPSLVTRSAKFGVSPVRFRRDFLRVPILPHSLNLYAGELKTLLLSGQLRNSLRLSLLPGLATAAALEMKITGSDKGIW